MELTKESETIEPLFILHENTLDDISMWDILDNFTETQTKLSTIKSSARWLRSSSLDKNNTLQLERHFGQENGLKMWQDNLIVRTRKTIGWILPFRSI